MNILILGGSNAGLHFGWAAKFQEMTPEHQTRNMFLGAVGSLYGLLRLIELERMAGVAPDLVIFEYALNDIVLLDAGSATTTLVHDALTDVAHYCARRNIRLLFLCLRPRPTGRARVYSCVRRIERIYAGVAKAHGMAECVTLLRLFGDERYDDFLDAHHLTETSSAHCARMLVEIVAQSEIPVPDGSIFYARAFDYTPATAAKAQGDCRTKEVTATVYAGTFLEIGRPGAALFPGHGNLAGVMLRSTEASGVFRIGAGGAYYRKNAQSTMREIVPALILLHYSTRRPFAQSEIEVAMPDDERALMSLREDRCLLPAPPEKPFLEQKLEIAGAMFWRASRLRRWATHLHLRLRRAIERQPAAARAV
jgi:hypothetical protein